MTGNIALDIVIGLVFVYLLYSMYATVMMEIIAATFGLRARNLCYALRRMLMDEIKIDGKEKSRFWTSVVQVTGRAPNLHNDLLYRKFFEQPSIKYLSSGGVNNKPSYLTPENFSRALIDAVRIDDSELTMLGSIQKGLSYGIADNVIARETGQQIQSLLDQANNDLSKFRILLQQWFADTMERSSGWYKRNVQIFLAIIGLVLALTFDVNTITIVRKLAQDKDAREQMVRLATSFSEENVALMESSRQPQATSVADAELKARLDSLNSLKAKLQRDMNSAQHVLGSAPGEFIGYLLTMLAISLGAPFWFDLLNKLVSLRSSRRPEESTTPGATSHTADVTNEVLNRVG